MVQSASIYLVQQKNIYIFYE